MDRRLGHALCMVTFLSLCSAPVLADTPVNAASDPAEGSVPGEIAFGQASTPASPGDLSIGSTGTTLAATTKAQTKSAKTIASTTSATGTSGQTGKQELALGQTAPPAVDEDQALTIAQSDTTTTQTTTQSSQTPKKGLALEPILLNYISSSYIGSETIFWFKNAAGRYQKHEQDSVREPGYLGLAGGKLPAHLGFFLEFAPDYGDSGVVTGAQKRGFFDKFGELQGTYNIGNAETFVQLRGGQINTYSGAGFGGSDRLAGPSPTMLGPINDFYGDSASGGFGKGLELSATFPEWTTLKAYGYFGGGAGGNTPTSEQNVVFGRPEGGGVGIEKVIGSTGLSGFSSYLNLEHCPVYTQYAIPTLNTAPTRQTDTIQWFFYANKTFLDKDNWERTNLMTGCMVGGSSYFVGLPPNPPGHSNYSYANGCFVQLQHTFIKGYLSVICQYSMFGQTYSIPNNAQQRLVVGPVFDIHGPLKSRGRFSFGWGMQGQEHSAPEQAMFFSYWPII